MLNQINTYLNSTTKAAPLAVFRIFFGTMMFLSIVRFWYHGWIEKLYIQPSFHFSYFGFEWVKPPGDWTYLLFIACGVSAIGVALGYKYRVAIITFFLTFTYIELMDKTTYLNHYYFISLLSFLMIFLPAEKYFSFDAGNEAPQVIPVWSIDAIKLLLAMVYFYAGLAKLNSDWLMEAMPLRIWLPGRYDLPLLGDLFQKEWMSYVFSWGGALYDLTIPFLLLWRKTRTVAFLLVVFFHVMTRVLFPIGMFPYIMIVSALIFFDAQFHERIISMIKKAVTVTRKRFAFRTKSSANEKSPFSSKRLAENSMYTPKWKLCVLSIFFMVQLLLPWRYLLYPGELFWTEEGYRFSWRVMLMEKAGHTSFKIKNPKTGVQFYVRNDDFLTSFQEKQMSTQPDFILEYAHFLKRHFTNQGHENVQVFVESYIALNGRRSQLFIDPNVELTQFHESFRHKTWILPFNDEIKGI